MLSIRTRFRSNQPLFGQHWRRSLAAHARAIIFKQTGEPASVLTTGRLRMPVEVDPSSIELRMLLAPVNPVDINVVQGAYARAAAKQELVCGEHAFVGGNEGVAVVEAVGKKVTGFQVGDWVNFGPDWAKGTWRSHVTAAENEIVKIPRANNNLSELQAAMLAINPATAYRMLHDFVQLKEGDVIMQNGANSAVGRAVISIAQALGVQTINFVRSRADDGALRDDLKNCGADFVFTYEELADRAAFGDRLRKVVGGRRIQLALNCVGGEATKHMARYLADDAFLVTYGGMSKQPLCLPSGQFIFRNLSSVGFGVGTWYKRHSAQDRLKMTKHLVEMMEAGLISQPASKIFSIDASASQAELEKVAEEIGRIGLASDGRKRLIKWES